MHFGWQGGCGCWWMWGCCVGMLGLCGGTGTTTVWPSLGRSLHFPSCLAACSLEAMCSLSAWPSQQSQCTARWGRNKLWHMQTVSAVVRRKAVLRHCARPVRSLLHLSMPLECPSASWLGFSASCCSWLCFCYLFLQRRWTPAALVQHSQHSCQPGPFLSTFKSRPLPACCTAHPLNHAFHWFHLQQATTVSSLSNTAMKASGYSSTAQLTTTRSPTLTWAYGPGE